MKAAMKVMMGTMPMKTMKAAMNTTPTKTMKAATKAMKDAMKTKPMKATKTKPMKVIRGILVELAGEVGPPRGLLEVAREFGHPS